MRLYPLEPTGRLALNITRISRKLHIDVLTTGLSEDQKRSLRSMILVTDGTPDDIVAAILAKHLDGETIVAIAKTRRTRVEALSVIPTYLTQIRGARIENLVALMDQEDEELNDIYESTSATLEGHGITIESQERMDERLGKYRCSHGGREFTLILIVNGLNAIKSSKHTIEDHLLYAAARLLRLEELRKMIEEGVDDPKDLWRTQKDRWESVYQGICDASIDDVREVFPQHIAGLKLIK